MTLGVCFAALFTIAKIMGAWTALCQNSKIKTWKQYIE
jgi:hypothetical protein